MSGPSRIAVRSSAPDLVVEAEAVLIGGDVLVWIYGGERPHIGAVAAAQPRPSLADPARGSATASVLTFLGHKEDIVAKSVSERLASALATNVVVTAGLHWDHLSPTQLTAVLARCDEVADLLVTQLKQRGGTQ